MMENVKRDENNKPQYEGDTDKRIYLQYLVATLVDTVLALLFFILIIYREKTTEKGPVYIKLQDSHNKAINSEPDIVLKSDVDEEEKIDTENKESKGMTEKQSYI